MKLFFTLALLFCVSAAISIPLSKWTCTYGTCITSANCGMTGGECVKLNSTTLTHSSFKSPQIPQATALSYWLVTTYSKCSGISPYFSFDGNIQTYSTGPSEVNSNWTRYEFLTRMSQNAGTKRLVLGLWEITGECIFSDVSISPAEVVTFTFPTFGPLGKGETISGGFYTATWGGDNILTNHARFITSFNSSYMDCMFRIYATHVLLMDHSLNVPFTSKPEIAVTVGNYFTGYVLIEASNDTGITWEIFGNISSYASVITTLPSVNYTQVRLRGIGPSIGDGVHIEKYSFVASVGSSSELEISGRDIVIVTDSKPSTNSANLSISFQNGSNGFPIWNSSSSFVVSLPIYITSQTASISTVSPILTITPRFAKTTISVSPSNISSLSPSSTISTTLSYKLQSGKPEIAAFTLFDSTNFYITGRIILNPPHILLDSSYGELLSTSMSSYLWWCDSNRKIGLHRPIPTTTSTKISISAARNEREPFQIVIHPKAISTVKINSISIGDLLNNKNGAILPSNAFTIRRELYVQTKIPSRTFEGLSGAYWPDPLVPLDLPYLCRAYSNCPFWIHVYIPSNQTEGDYSGSISISTAAGTITATHLVTLQLRVYNFSIPKHTKLKSRFGVREGILWKYHHINASSPTADKEALSDFYLKDLEEHRFCPISPHHYQDFGAKLVQNSSGSYNWAWSTSNFEANYLKYYDPDIGMGFPSNERTLVGMNGGNGGNQVNGTINGYPWGSSEHTRLFKEYALGVQNELVKTGMINKTQFIWFYEPKEADFAYVKEGMQAIKNAAPLLKRFLTQTADERLFGYVDTWCGSLSEYNPIIAKERQSAGDSVWIDGFLHLIDYPLMKIRMMLWFMAMNNIEGLFIWAPNMWHSDTQYPNSTQDPYSDPISWTGGKDVVSGNGDALLFYPPINWNQTSSLIFDKPVDSIRWEIMTEGVEDWEYYQLLKAALKNPDLTTQRRNKVDELLNIPSSFMYDSDFYTENPDDLYERRKLMANLLEELQTILPEKESSSEIKQSVVVVINFETEVTDLLQLENEISQLLGIDVSQIQVIMISSTQIQVVITGQSLSVIQENAKQLVEQINDGTIQSQILRDAIDAYIIRNDSEISSSVRFHFNFFLFILLLSFIDTL